MRTNQFNFLIFFIICLITLFSCGGPAADDNDDVTRNLETGANIKSFPIIVILSDKLYGNAFPKDIQSLASLSKENECKTLPVAGILRLGRMYYTFNCVSDLKITPGIEKDEASITKMVDNQVNDFLATSRLDEYDSLLTTNDADWNVKDLALSYIDNTSDTIFFFSNSPAAPSEVELKNKKYPVFKNTTELRKQIDKIVCASPRSISIFYNFGTPNTAEAAPPTKATVAAKGTRAGDTCIGQTKYERLHDGSGGFVRGDIIEANSTDCGYVYPTGIAGDTCVNGSKFQKLYDGKGGFRVGNLIERNSKACGFRYPTGLAGDTCISGSKFQKLHNGRGGFSVGTLIERNSIACGFKFPTGLAGDTCVSGSKFQRLHNGKGGFVVGKLIEKNSKACGFKFPTGLAGDTCVSGSKFQRLHNGKGGFVVGKLIERNSRACGFKFPTGVAGDTCVSGSKFQRLHNGRGGFMVGKLIERNSRACGFKFPTGLAGDTCISGSRFQRMHNGKGGFMVGNLIERNSKACGFKFPTGLAGDTCVGGSKYQKLHNGRGGFMRGRLIKANSTECGFVYPARGTVASGFICFQGSKFAKLNDGKGGFVRGNLVEANSSACQVTKAPKPAASDTRCVSRSEPICEQDSDGNYTGRRVQLCYNSSGRVIQTIVIKKCEADCRCIGN